MNIKQTAKKLQRMGGDEDTILAHINEEEAALLKAGGGSGKKNPKTGLLSFGYGDGFDGGYDGPAGSGAYGGADINGPVNDAGLGAALAEALGKLSDPMSGMGQTPDINYVAPVPNPMLQTAGKYGPAVASALGFPLLGTLLGGAAYLDRNRTEQNIGSGFGGSAWGGTPSTGIAEGGLGGDYAMSGRDNPGAYAGGLLGAPLAQPAALPQYTRPPFVSKFGGPRSWATSAYSPARRGLLGS